MAITFYDTNLWLEEFKYIKIPYVLFTMFDGTDAVILLGYLMSWTKNEDEWVYQTNQNIRSAIGFKRSRLETATERLKEIGLIETKVEFINGNKRTHYKVNLNKVSDTIDMLREEKIYLPNKYTENAFKIQRLSVETKQ